MASVEKVGIEDLDELLKLAIKIFTETFEAVNNPVDFKKYLDEAFNDKKIREEFNENDSQFFKVVEAEKIIGYARLRKNNEVTHLIGRSNMELQRIYVDALWQGKDIANQLLKVCEEYVQQLGIEWIWLGVWEHNPKAQHFYKKHGYEKFSEHKFMVGNDEQTDWLMKKRLNNP